MLPGKTEAFVTNVRGSCDDDENAHDALPEQNTVDERLDGEEIGGEHERGDGDQPSDQD
jgi:hypothetical protein